MALFPFISDGMRNFMSGFQHSQKTDFASLADDAPPLETKAVGFMDDGFAFGTGADGYIGTLGNGFRRFPQGGSGWANEPVTIDTAQTLSAVHACRRILCETMASLPFAMVQRTAPGELTFRDDMPIHDFMVHGNDERSGFGMMETWMGHLIFQGNAFGLITRRSGKNRTALDIEMLLPEWVQPLREVPWGRLKYVITRPGRPIETYYVNPGEPHDILHIRGYGYDGLKGYSLLHLARQTLSTGLGMEKNYGRFLANGGRVPYLLKKEVKFENNAKFMEFRQKWFEKFSDPHTPVLLEGDITYQQIGISARDAQLLESRMLSVPEICRFLGVSPTLVFDLTKANYNSLEQLIRSFINFTLSGWMNRIKGDFRRCVLTPEEKRQNIFPRYDLAGIEKADFQTRMTGYSQGLVNGIYSINEVREKEGMEPIPGLDEHLVQMQMAQVPAGGVPQDPDEVELEEADD